MWEDDAASRGLGMEAQVVEVDHARVRMTVTESMVNGHDIAHGGFIFSLADSTFALACNSRGQLTVAAGADITFVSAARRGDVLRSRRTGACDLRRARDHRRHSNARVRRCAGRGVPRAVPEPARPGRPTATGRLVSRLFVSRAR